MSIYHAINQLLVDPKEKEPEEILDTSMEETPKETAPSSLFGETLVNMEAQVVDIKQNTDQKFIIVTQDKAIIALKKNIAQLGKNVWVAPLSTVTTIFITLLTSNFKTAIWLGPSEWRAMFVISGLIAIGWLVHAIHRSFHAKTTNEVITDIVLDIRNQKRIPPPSFSTI